MKLYIHLIEETSGHFQTRDCGPEVIEEETLFACEEVISRLFHQVLPILDPDIRFPVSVRVTALDVNSLFGLRDSGCFWSRTRSEGLVSHREGGRVSEG